MTTQPGRGTVCTAGATNPPLPPGASPPPVPPPLPVPTAVDFSQALHQIGDTRPRVRRQQADGKEQQRLSLLVQPTPQQVTGHNAVEMPRSRSKYTSGSPIVSSSSILYTSALCEQSSLARLSTPATTTAYQPTTSSETLVRSFSCTLPRRPSASKPPAHVRRGILRNSHSPPSAGRISLAVMRPAPVEMIPTGSSLSSSSKPSRWSASTMSASSSSPSLSSMAMGGEPHLPRPILRQCHSHSVVRTSSPLRQQVGFDEDKKPRPRSSLSHELGTERIRRGRGGSKVAWAQTVHETGQSDSIMGLDLSAPSMRARPVTAPRPSTYHDRPNRASRLRRQPSLSSIPSSRSSTPSGLWNEEPYEMPANHPSTVMPGFPAMEFSDLRAPKFSRAGLRNSGVVMPVAARRPASVVVSPPTPEPESEPKGLGSIARRISRRMASSPSLRDLSQTLSASPSPRVASPQPRPTSTHLPSGAAMPDRPVLGPPAAPPPPGVFVQLPPGAGLPTYAPRPAPPRGASPRAAPQLPPGMLPAAPQNGRGLLVGAPPRAITPTNSRPPLRHFRSSPGIRPVPLEPLPEMSPTSPSLATHFTHGPLPYPPSPVKSTSSASDTTSPALSDTSPMITLPDLPGLNLSFEQFGLDSPVSPTSRTFSQSAPGTPLLSGIPISITEATPERQLAESLSDALPPLVPPPRGTSLEATGSRPSSLFTTSGSRNRSRSPSVLSLCSDRSTISSQRSISSLTTASSAASVDMPDPIAEDDGDDITVASSTPSVDVHSPSSLSSITPLHSPVEGAIIKSVNRVRTAAPLRMHM